MQSLPFERLIPLTQPAELVAAGIPFRTTNSARWPYRRRHEIGLAGAFVRLGGRIYANAERFHELAKELAQ